MQLLLQRVTTASVSIDNQEVGKIANGLLVFLGVEKQDTQAHADKLLHKLLNYRVFADAEDKMNLSLLDIQGELLIISQFTLAADTKKGLRPSFSTAASPADGESLYQYFVSQAQASGLKIATGKFGADMQVSLVNDGPVTFLLNN